MDVRLGVSYSPKELTVELDEGTDVDALRVQVDEALSAGTGALWLTDRRGRQIGVPVDKLTFVEIGSPDTARRVGFGT